MIGEVGVGKTIETWIILTEPLARGRITRRNRVLIVCTNILGPKSVKEMKERFNLNFSLHDGRSLRTALFNNSAGNFSIHKNVPSNSLLDFILLSFRKHFIILFCLELGGRYPALFTL
jgi:hypothetical protein